MRITEFESRYLPLLKQNSSIELNQYNSKAYSERTGNISVHPGEFDSSKWNYIYLGGRVFHIPFNEEILYNKTIVKDNKKTKKTEVVSFGLISGKVLQELTLEYLTPFLGYSDVNPKTSLFINEWQKPWSEASEIKKAPAEESITTSDFKKITNAVADLLEYKNKKYGDSALNPLNIFNGKSKVGQRMDDKLARIQNSIKLNKNDIVDLMGYLILVCKENQWETFEEFKD